MIIILFALATTVPGRLRSKIGIIDISGTILDSKMIVEQLDELKTLMIASLAINRIVSIFDVIAISRQHGGSFSFDTYEESDEAGFKLNYNF